MFYFSLQAANPGAEMEDFVRWHSPRDWIEEEMISPDGFKIQGGISFSPNLLEIDDQKSSMQDKAYSLLINEF